MSFWRLPFHSIQLFSSLFWSIKFLDGKVSPDIPLTWYIHCLLDLFILMFSETVNVLYVSCYKESEMLTRINLSKKGFWNDFFIRECRRGAIVRTPCRCYSIWELSPRFWKFWPFTLTTVLCPQSHICLLFGLFSLLTFNVLCYMFNIC
jgi:hypothetical protein